MTNIDDLKKIWADRDIESFRKEMAEFLRSPAWLREELIAGYGRQCAARLTISGLSVIAPWVAEDPKLVWC